MTAVGKILVFLNLVFSLVVGAFVIMIYLARTHWAADYSALTKKYTVSEASARTYQAEAQKAQQDAAVVIGKKDAELQNAQKDLAAAQNANTQLRDDLAKLKAKSTQDSALATKQGVETVKRQDDVEKLRETLRKEQQANNALVKKNAELTSEATVAKIDRQSIQDQNSRLEAQLQRMAKDMARMRSGGGAATARAGGKNPPPDDIEGLVNKVDVGSSGILMTLTIGSDSGLARGQTLELFRPNLSAPSQSKYLGTVRILEAEAKQAVAQPVGRLTDKPRRGDTVASRIRGS